MVGLIRQVICKRSSNRLPSFYPHRPLFDHSRCFQYGTKGADGAADLLEVLRNSPLEKLNFENCLQIPSSAWQKLRGASWSNLREANFELCLVLQVWLRCLASPDIDAVFVFSMLRAIVTAVSLTTFGNIERPKMWHRQLQMVGLSKVTCKRSGNKLPSFIPTVPFWALQVLSQWHQCRWGRRPAGSLAELSPGEVGLSLLLENSVLCVAASSQWRVACAAWCTRHPQGGVAPHPWPRRLEAASGAVGGCGGCGVARGDGWIAVHNLWVFAFIWAFWQVRYDDLAPVYISMSPLYMRLPVGKRLEILQEILKYFWGNRLHPIVVIWNVQLKMVWVSWHLRPARKTLRHPTFSSIPGRKLSIIACDMHGKTFSQNDLKQTKDPTDRF